MQDKWIIQVFWAKFGWVNMPEEFLTREEALHMAKRYSHKHNYKDVRLVEVVYNYHEVDD